MQQSFFLNVILTALLLCPLVSEARVYYVTPAESAEGTPSQCPTNNIKQCHSLDEYAQLQSESGYLEHQNVSLLFLKGTHKLNRNFTLYNVSFLGLFAIDNTSPFPPIVVLGKGANIIITNVTHSLVLDGVQYSSHGTTVVFLMHVHNAVVIHTHFIHAVLELHNPHEVTVISNSSFYYGHTQLSILYHSTLYNDETRSLLIDNVSFINGVQSVNVVQANDSNQDLYIRMVNVTTNRSEDFPLVFFFNDSPRDLTFIKDSRITGSSGIGIYVVTTPGTKYVSFNLSNTDVSWHRQSALIYVHDHVPVGSSDIRIENCNFYKNDVSQRALSYFKGAAMTMVGTNFRSSLKAVIINTTFEFNHNFLHESATVVLKNTDNVEFVDCHFGHNQGTPIYAHESDFTLSGHDTFMHNTAYVGGAIGLYKYSNIFLKRHTTLVFQNNSAKHVGGAVFVEVVHYEECFFQLLDFHNASDLSVHVEFINNTAMDGGEDIYVSSLAHDCHVSDNKVVRLSQITHEMFDFEPKVETSLSSIASDPTRVCLCNSTTGQPNCSDLNRIFVDDKHYYPGEVFALSAVLVGFKFGTVSGAVYASFLPHPPNHPLIAYEQQSQSVVYSKCNTLHYSVFSPNEHEVMVLTANDETVELYGDKQLLNQTISESKTGLRRTAYYAGPLLITPIFINISLLPCPAGFNLSGDPPSCICDKTLTKNGIACNITNHTGYVYRSGTVWVSVPTDVMKGVIVHKYCQYCDTMMTPLDLRHPDTQCLFNHSGTLCGGCLPGLSLALGSSRCLSCSNSYIALLIVFMLAGILLVLLINVLNLTVSQGTINGLIFYVNIIWVNKSILFPTVQENSRATLILKVFIAWLNLDLGIETCFFEGLDAYFSSWLQFAFPIYIWVIALFIIVLSARSVKVTKILGNNSVPTLATLFLLSHSKLLCATITALGFTFLDLPDGSRSIVWSIDGNIEYFGKKHAPLLLFAVITLVFIFTTFTLKLLLIQLLKRFSHCKLLRWVSRLNPYFDAYIGPLQPNHQYWVGLLLVVRVALFVLFALTSSILPTVNLFAMLVVGVGLTLYSNIFPVYRERYLSVLESSFFINLIIVGGGTLFVDPQLTGINRTALLYPPIGVVFLQFISIIAFHTWKVVKRKKQMLGLQLNGYEDINEARSPVRDTDDEEAQFREPLLSFDQPTY